MGMLQRERPTHSMIRVELVDTWLEVTYPPRVRGRVRGDVLMECPACGALWNQSTQRWERPGDQNAIHLKDPT